MLQNYCDIIIQIIPEEVMKQVSKDSRAFDTHELANLDEHKLASIHRMTKRKISELRMYTSWLN
jgi:hypothetical protein